MSGRTTSSRGRRSASAKGATRSSRPASAAKKTKSPTAKKRASGSSDRARARPARKAAPNRTAGTPAPEPSAGQILERAEANVTAVIESLNHQMNTALATLAELASAGNTQGRAVVRTAPLDRAAAMFQRLVAGVVEEQLAEMLPPLIALRNEMAHCGCDTGAVNGSADEFYRRGLETLDHVLTQAGVETYEARVGEVFDPLIHLAVGETHRDDLAGGAVAEPLQCGFRSAHGKVIVPAKVRVNRKDNHGSVRD